jgi:YihY family inner membrane protein
MLQAIPLGPVRPWPHHPPARHAHLIGVLGRMVRLAPLDPGRNEPVCHERELGSEMNIVERAVRRVDAFQQSKRPLAFVFGVIKKFGDDAGSSLAALLTYYGFLSLFPLLLVLITILGLVATPGMKHAVVHSVLAQFPIVGNELTGPHGIQVLKASSLVGLIVGLLGLMWGSLGVTQAAQRAMAEVWNVPGVVRPGFVPRLARSVLFLGVLALDVIFTTVLTGFPAFGGHALGTSILAAVAAVLVDIALYIAAFRVLTPKAIETHCLITGAVIAGVGWAILQQIGTFLVAHQLRHSSQIYGYFASILGLIAFLYLASQITLYAAELNVVRERHLYPRSIVQPPLTDADRETLADIARQGERRPEQRVDVRYPGVESEQTTQG